MKFLVFSLYLLNGLYCIYSGSLHTTLWKPWIQGSEPLSPFLEGYVKGLFTGGRSEQIRAEIVKSDYS